MQNVTLITRNDHGMGSSTHPSEADALKSVFDELARGMTVEELEAVPGDVAEGVAHMIHEIEEAGGTYEYDIQPDGMGNRLDGGPPD